MTAELINLDTGEVVSYADAHESVNRARDHVNGFWQEVKWQVDNHVWQVLGYDGFQALWDAEYEGLGVSISRAERPELVASMRSIGQTQQEIADKLGVDHRTVGRDLNGQMPNEDSKITNSRGQERPASYKPREPDPEPEPEVVDAEIVDDDEWTSASDALSGMTTGPGETASPNTADRLTGSRIQKNRDAGYYVWDYEKLLHLMFGGHMDDLEPLLHDSVTAEQAADLLDDLSKTIRVLRRIKPLISDRKGTSCPNE